MYIYIKRILDIICASLGILFTSPIWIVAIIGILFSDYGPIFYSSTRIGKNNRPFTMYKFRSMRIVKSANERSLRADTDRIFPFGYFIRKYKIDELPQLINVLNGTMSVIGPRPVSDDQKDLFRVGKWNLAAEVNVGLSGPAALYDYLYGDQFQDEEEYMQRVFPTRRDLEYAYVKKMGFFYDLKMVFWTIASIIYTIIGKTPKRILAQLELDAATI